MAVSLLSAEIDRRINGSVPQLFTRQKETYSLA